MRSRRLFATMGVLAVLSLVASFVSPVLAAGVTVTVSPTELSANTATDVTVSYTPSSTEFASGDTVTITVASGVTLADCSSSTTDADGDSTNDGSASVSGQTYTYTFNAATTTATTGGVSFCINLSAPTGNYSVAVTDDNDDDFGAALVYVGDDNDVTVTAAVQPVLAFTIRNSADTADTNECDLGVLSLSSVNTCSYRLKVTANADSGYTVQVTTDGDLRKSGSGDVADSEDIDLVTEDTTVTAGTEGYGIALTSGSATGGTITESGDFNDDDTPLPTSATNLYTSDGPNNPSATDTTNTTLVTHRAAMDGDTQTGNYSQTVTYTVTASF